MTESATQPLAGQVAVVTGAGRGIGAAIAGKLAELGARTVLCGRTRAALETTAAAIQNNGHQCSIIECDVTDLASVTSLADRVQRTFNRLNILVNNAGIMEPQLPLHELAPEAWDRTMNTNLRGVYYMIRGFAPLMIRAQSGHIINISSLAGKNALPSKPHLRGLQMGSQWPELFGSRGIARSQHPRRSRVRSVNTV